MSDKDNATLIQALKAGHPGATVSVAQSGTVEAFQRFLRIGRKVNSSPSRQSTVEPYYVCFNKQKRK